MMEQRNLSYFKNLLESWLQELLVRAGSTVDTLKEPVDSQADPLDRALVEADLNFTLRIRDRESTLIKKIRESLVDIESGDYGICVRCGQEISLVRLRARPVARHCIKCKTLMEQTEKLTAD